MQTAAMPILVIAPNHPRFERWRHDHGLPSGLARFISSERDLRGTFDRHVVIIDVNHCPPRTRQLVLLAHQEATRRRLTVHETSTADRPVLSGEELRARYGDQCEMVDPVEPVLELLGVKDVDPRWAVAFRYATLEALEAFTEGNRRHYSYATIGPVIGPDGFIYGVTVLDPPESGGGVKHDDAAAANTG